MSHERGAPIHPQTQGKIERWHQTLKNRIWLKNDVLPDDLEAQIDVCSTASSPPELKPRRGQHSANIRSHQCQMI